MEEVVDTQFGGRLAGRRVLVTGHTGFKGAWLCEWLLTLGAEVHGLALDPLPGQELFEELRLPSRLAGDRRADIRKPAAVATAVREVRPEIVLHLAAQPIVRRSYREPLETFATNVMGTAHVLEAIRQVGGPCAAVMVTTDKCYENREWLHAYREDDPMGGHDPYSASKGAAELVVASYRRSFFPAEGTTLVATARAGNVIGGGDWAEDRIVPDAMRALAAGRPIEVRNPRATRPWQHVLEPLSGYLALASELWNQLAVNDTARRRSLASAFNFGPSLASNQPVSALVREALRHWPGSWDDVSQPGALHEATLLNLATDKATHLLGWAPVWDFPTTLARTVAWYRNPEQADAHSRTAADLLAYAAAARALRLPWACAPAHS